MNTGILVALLIVWLVLAIVFYFLWRSGVKDGDSAAKNDKTETLAMIAKEHRKLGIEPSETVDRLKQTGEADPKALAERLKTWLGESDDDKISK